MANLHIILLGLDLLDLPNTDLHLPFPPFFESKMSDAQQPKYWELAAARLGTGLALKPVPTGRPVPTTLREAIDADSVLDALDKVLPWIIFYEQACHRNSKPGDVPPLQVEFLIAVDIVTKIITEDGYDIVSSPPEPREKQLAIGNLIFGHMLLGSWGPMPSEEMKDKLAFGLFRRFYHVARRLMLEAVSSDLAHEFIGFRHTRGTFATLFCYRLIGFSPISKRLASDVEFLGTMVRFASRSIRFWAENGYGANNMAAPVEVLLAVLLADRGPFVSKFKSDPICRLTLTGFVGMLRKGSRNWQKRENFRPKIRCYSQICAGLSRTWSRNRMMRRRSEL